MIKTIVFVCFTLVLVGIAIDGVDAWGWGRNRNRDRGLDLSRQRTGGSSRFSFRTNARANNLVSTLRCFGGKRGRNGACNSGQPANSWNRNSLKPNPYPNQNSNRRTSWFPFGETQQSPILAQPPAESSGHSYGHTLSGAVVQGVNAGVISKGLSGGFGSRSREESEPQTQQPQQFQGFGLRQGGGSGSSWTDTTGQFERSQAREPNTNVRDDASSSSSSSCTRYPVSTPREKKSIFCTGVCKPSVPVAPPNIGIQIQFLLYTSDEPTVSQKLIVNEGSGPWTGVQVMNGADTIIICHGFKSNPTSGPGEKLRDEYFKYYKSLQRKLNIILVDWSPAAKGWQTYEYDVNPLRKIYFPAAAHVKGVGIATKYLIRKLKARAGVTLEQIHLIGHSLGAQVMGYAGKELGKDSDMGNERQVSRITALDPAAPCFEQGAMLSSSCIPLEHGYLHVSKNDAKFVDVIHSNGALFGMKNPVGHVDFYPNGGEKQPGCDRSDVACSHSRAIDLMAASINRRREDFKAVRCPDACSAIKKTCKDNNLALLNYLGQHVKRDTRNHGIYYLETLSTPPFTSTFL